MTKLTGTCIRCGKPVASTGGLTWWTVVDGSVTTNRCPANLVNRHAVEHFAPSQERPNPATARQALTELGKLHALFLQLVASSLTDRPELLEMFTGVPEAVREHDRRMPPEKYPPSWIRGYSEKVEDLKRQPFFRHLHIGDDWAGFAEETQLLTERLDGLMAVVECVAAWLRSKIVDCASGWYQAACDVEHVITWAKREIAKHEKNA